MGTVVGLREDTGRLGPAGDGAAAVGRSAPPAGEARWARLAAWAAPLAYLVLAVLLLPRFRHLFNKDEISYVSIARLYADGDVLRAVNSYWAPLISWLLAPLLVVGMAQAAAAKALSVLIGLLTFLAVRRISSRFEMDERIRALLLALLVPLVLTWSLIAFTPDLLTAAILLLYLSVVVDRDYPARRFAGLLAGGLGALLFFSKSYGLPFFLGHFVLVSAAHAFLAADRPARRAVLRHALVGLGVFGALVLAWGGLLAQKYGQFTLGTGPTYNHAIVGPDSPDRPILYWGFVPPPYEARTSVWEEPHWFAERLEGWSPLESPAALRHQLRLVASNTESTLEVVEDFSAFAPGLLLAAVALCVVPRARLRSRVPLLLSVGSLAVYAAGYTLVHSEERYLWGGLLVLLVVAGHLLHLLFRTGALRGVLRPAILVGAVSLSLLPHHATVLRENAGNGSEVNAIADRLRDSGVDLGGADVASMNDFGASNVVAHRLGARYWGQAPEGATEPEVVEALRPRPIRWFLVWDAPALADPAFEPRLELREGDRRLLVYAVG